MTRVSCGPSIIFNFRPPGGMCVPWLFRISGYRGTSCPTYCSTNDRAVAAAQLMADRRPGSTAQSTTDCGIKRRVTGH